MRSGTGWPSAWRLAVGTLTVLPTRPPASVDQRVAGRAMMLAAPAVLPLAGSAAAAGWLAARTAWPDPVPGLVVVAVLALGTRALHLDGLADTVDGLGSGRTRDRALQIMRTGDIGPMGVVALVAVLGGQAAAASVLTRSWPDALLLAVVITASRVSLPFACRRGVPAARPDGLGATVAGSVAGWAAVAAAVLAAVALAGTAAGAGRGWWLGPLAVGTAGLVASAVVIGARQRLGGITGDVLGAVVELSVLALLLVITV